MLGNDIDQRSSLDLTDLSLYIFMTCGQSYKASTIVIYESRVVNVSNLLVITTVEL